VRYIVGEIHRTAGLGQECHVLNNATKRHMVDISGQTFTLFLYGETLDRIGTKNYCFVKSCGGF